MICFHFSLMVLPFSSHQPRENRVRHPPCSTPHQAPSPLVSVEISKCGPQQSAPRKAALLHPSCSIGPSCPISHSFMWQRLTSLGSRFPATSLHPGSVQDSEQTNNSNTSLSFEVFSLTPSFTHPFKFAVTQQPDFTEN